MATTQTNTQYTLNWKDAARGLLMAALGAVLVFLQSSFENGEVVFEWNKIINVAIIAGVGYLIKNFFTPSEIVIVNPPKDEIAAVKKGQAEVKVLK